MAEKNLHPNGDCPCSKGIDRRDFLKVTAMAGLLAGCNPALESPTPTSEPAATATPKPTLAPGQTEVPDLAGKKALYVLPRESYAVGCHDASVSVLKACGIDITLSALEKKEIVVWGGGTPDLMPDILVSEVKVADFDAVIFECGQPLESFNPDYQKLVKETIEQNKVLAAVCMWPALLASTGVLNGKEATSNGTETAALQQFGAVLSDKDPVRDGKIVTSSYNGINKFGWLVIEALQA